MNLRMKTFSLFALFVLLAGTTLAVPPAAAQTHGWEGQIAYLGADGNLWLVRGDNPQPFQLTSDASDQRRYSSPIFSPQGEMLAFCRDDNAGAGPAQIYLMRSGSWQPILIAEDVFCAAWPQGSFSWSPDGAQIAYARTFEYAPQPDGSQWSKYHGIWVADITTGSQGELVPPPGKNPLIHPSWSPDGHWLRMYETVSLEGTGVLRTWDRESGALYNWLSIGTDIFPGFAGWSPDSSRLVMDEAIYIGYPGAGLFTAAPGGGDFKEIYHNDAHGALHPMWSPDGQNLAFLLREYGGNEQSILAVSSPDGSNLKWIFASPAVLEIVDWSPNSRQVLFTSTESTETGNQTGLYIYDLDASAHFDVAYPAGGQADWAPQPADEKPSTGGGSSQITGFRAEGSLLAYLAGNYQLMLYDPSSGSSAELSPPLAALDFWASPSGTRLVYGSQLLRLQFNEDGSLAVHEIELPSFPTGEQIVWSPDETRLAFQDAEGRVYMVDSAGDFVEVPGASGLPSWSFDGRYLSYCTEGGHLWVVGGGVSLREVASPVDYQGQWSPSLPLLVYTVKGDTSKSDQVYVYDAEKGLSEALEQGAESVGWSPDGLLIALRKPTTETIATYIAIDPRKSKILEVGQIDSSQPGLQGWGGTADGYILGAYQFDANLRKSERIAEILYDTDRAGQILLAGQQSGGLREIICLDIDQAKPTALLSVNLTGIPNAEKPGLWSWLSPDSIWTATFAYDPSGYRYLLTRCDRSRQVSIEYWPPRWSPGGDVLDEFEDDGFSPDSDWYLQVVPGGDGQGQILLYDLITLDRQSLPVLTDGPVVWVQAPEVTPGDVFVVSGSVVAADGTPVSDAEVLLDGQVVATTDKQGEFSLPGLEQGKFSLSIQKEGWTFTPAQVDVTTTEETAPLTFQAWEAAEATEEAAALPTETSASGDDAGAQALTTPEAAGGGTTGEGGTVIEIPGVGTIPLQAVWLALGGLGVLLLALLISRIRAARRRAPLPPPAEELAAEAKSPPMTAAAASSAAEAGSKSGPRAPTDRLLREGVVLVKSGNNAAGLDMLQQVVQNVPDNAVAWLWSGMAATRLKKWDQAADCFRKAQKLGHPKANEALKWLSEQQDQG